MDFGGAGSALSVQHELSLHALAGLLTHPRRDSRAGGPRLTRGRGSLRSRCADGMSGRTLAAGRAPSLSAHIDCTGLGRVGEEARQRGAAPPALALGRRDATRPPRLGQPHKGLRLMAVAAQHLWDHRPCRRLHLATRRGARPLRRPPLALRWRGPGAQDTGPPFPLPPAAPACRNHRTFIVGRGAAY